jgi:hypothetical protein
LISEAGEGTEEETLSVEDRGEVFGRIFSAIWMLSCMLPSRDLLLRTSPGTQGAELVAWADGCGMAKSMVFVGCSWSTSSIPNGRSAWKVLRKGPRSREPFIMRSPPRRNGESSMFTAGSNDATDGADTAAEGSRRDTPSPAPLPPFWCCTCVCELESDVGGGVLVMDVAVG